MEITIKERLVMFMSKMKISQRRFESACGLSNGYINSLKKSPSGSVLQRIFGAYPELNQDWLLKGEGNMIINDSMKTNDGIPLIPVNAIGGFMSGISDPIRESDCERYVIPAFSGVDFLVRVDGDSMMPKYMPGDIVACKKVTNKIWYQWGKVYVVDTKQGALIKRIEPSGDDAYISLCSENEKYKPLSMPVEDINGIAIVKGIIRVE